MTGTDAPQDGDFAAYLEGKRPMRAGPLAGTDPAPAHEPGQAAATPAAAMGDAQGQPVQTEADLLEELDALQGAPELSDEEIERQALAAPGADGNPNTPE